MTYPRGRMSRCSYFWVPRDLAIAWIVDPCAQGRRWTDNTNLQVKCRDYTSRSCERLGPFCFRNQSPLPTIPFFRCFFFFLLWRALPYLRSMGKWTCAQRHLFATPRFLVAFWDGRIERPSAGLGFDQSRISRPQDDSFLILVLCSFFSLRCRMHLSFVVALSAIMSG